jgi:hypothetical protein
MAIHYAHLDKKARKAQGKISEEFLPKRIQERVQ